MLELIFQGFMEWAYGLALECWEYFSSSLLSIMSMDYAYMKSHVPVMVSIAQVLLAVGWALLIGNLVFQALKSMAVGLGFEGEDPKLLFTRTFVFAFLLMASPQICEVGLSLTARIIELLEIPDAINVTLVDEGVFGSLGAAWLLVIIFGLIIMFKVFRLLLEIAERYVILAVLTMTAPLAFAMGGSKSTSEIFGGWCRMFGSMCTLMVTNVIFFKMLLSVLSNVPSGLDIIPWIVLVLTIVKVARKADAIITRIGLNPAITGDSLGRGFPGTLTYMVMRSATSHINKYIVLDLSGMPDDMIADGTFWATSIAYDLIMSCESDLSALLADELWSLVGATANPQAAGFVLEMVKTIRGLGGIAVTSTQGMQDLFGLDGGSYGKGILDASRIKLVMQMEEQEARLIQDKLNLSEDEVRQITRFRRGEGLLCIGYNHVPVAFHTTPKEYEAITTSPTDLRRGRSEYGDE